MNKHPYQAGSGQGKKPKDTAVIATLITAVATVLAAVISGAFILASRDSSGANSNGPSPVVRSVAPAVQPTGQSSSGSTDDPNSTPSGSFSVFSEEDSVRITADGLDLDVNPPNSNMPDGVDSDVSLEASPRAHTSVGGDGSALWTQDGAPDASGCAHLVATQAQHDINVRVGSTVCVQTGAGRIAALTFRSLSSDPADSSSLAGQVKVTVWES